ncbi:unnamed protein product [Cuscuta campestris]|uniref:S1 motif domain-containing protein n=2 Tax=Cuscuta sect. Cleistogrammica TaxID=1824901 RepID=A0A484LKX7_9ASTE|nr:hypothetical protein DM860_013409 [Cuscuta australis]VFQ76957.1 unnamed protein product [Cuscuta campestris]
MASLAQQIGVLKCPYFSNPRAGGSSKKFAHIHSYTKNLSVVCQAAAALSNAQTRERQDLKEMFGEAYERCSTAPMEGVSFTMEDFQAALDKYDVDCEIGSKIKGTVTRVLAHGAFVDVNTKSPAFLPLIEACIHPIKKVEEASIIPGLREEFVVIGKYEANDSLILSLRSLQYDIAWERCWQLQNEDVIVNGKVVGANRGGVMAMVEGLRAFVPFSQMSTKSTDEELLGKEIPLKFVEVDEEESRLVLSNRQATIDGQVQFGVGSVVVGTVQDVKPYGAFIDLGGINGLLHVSQISHDRVSDIATVLQPGDTLKVMVLSHDRDRGRVSLSTKKLEPTPGDMIRNPTLVFEKAEEMAQTFRQRIAQAEALARADILRFQPESGLSLSSDGVLGPLGPNFPADGLDLSSIPLAEDSFDSNEIPPAEESFDLNEILRSKDSLF